MSQLRNWKWQKKKEVAEKSPLIWKYSYIIFPRSVEAPNYPSCFVWLQCKCWLGGGRILKSQTVIVIVIVMVIIIITIIIIRIKFYEKIPVQVLRLIAKW